MQHSHPNDPAQERSKLWRVLRRVADREGFDLEAELGRAPPPEAPRPRPSSSTSRTSPTPKATKAEKREAAKDRRRRSKERNERRDRAQAVKLEKRATDEGWNASDPIELQLGSEAKLVRVTLRPLRVVAWWIQLAMWAVMLDPSGRTANYRLRRMRNKVLAGWTRRIAYAAADRREERRGWKARGNIWADLRARRVVAVGFFYDAMQERHRVKGRWLCHVDGVTVDFLRWLIRDPFQHYAPGCFLPYRKPGNKRAYRSAHGVPCQTTVTGKSRREGRWEDGTCGVIEAFRQVDAVFTRSNVALPQKYATRSGYQPNDYVIVSDVIEHHEHSAELAALVEWELDQASQSERAPPVAS